MYTWDPELTAEYNRQRIAEEFEQLRKERLALKSRIYRPRFFARTMYSFANWMISTGKDLRRRYEMPAVNHGQPTTESFAQ